METANILQEYVSQYTLIHDRKPRVLLVSKEILIEWERETSGFYIYRPPNYTPEFYGIPMYAYEEALVAK